MRAIEALERLIKMSDDLLGLHPSHRPENEDCEDDKAAIAICQAMVNTAIPIARFRIHAEVRNPNPKKTKTGLCDFTVSGTTIQSVKAGILALKDEEAQGYVTLWEQHADTAEMLSGYQGTLKSQKFRLWLQQIEYYQTEPTVQ